MQRSESIERAARDFYGGLDGGDVKALEGLISADDGVLVIGTDPAEWWDSRAKIMRAFEAQVAEMKDFTFRPGDIQGFEAGDTGWFADRGEIVTPDGSTIAIRLTGAAVRDGEGWRFVQLHVSVGAANEDVVGQELTV
jgi:hypothetical protein